MVVKFEVGDWSIIQIWPLTFSRKFLSTFSLSCEPRFRFDIDQTVMKHLQPLLTTFQSYRESLWTLDELSCLADLKPQRRFYCHVMTSLYNNVHIPCGEGRKIFRVSVEPWFSKLFDSSDKWLHISASKCGFRTLTDWNRKILSTATRSK